MKTSKRIISLVLCAVMVLGTFLSLGPVVSFEAEAAEDITLGGITQQRVVGTDDSYKSIYRSYQKRFFNGEETNWPTDFVIPGLSSSNDYTPQGMTYWKAKEWILISAYDASGQKRNSVIYALDAVTTKMVALFKIQNADGTTNTSHGGGIAASEHNFYYADSASKISYIPLSEMDVAPNTEKTIKLKESVNLAGEMTGPGKSEAVKTSYCCYDEGVLWTGNFYYSGDGDYDAQFHTGRFHSVLMGYKLAGNSSAEEWYYLKNGYNIVKLTNPNTKLTVDNGAAKMTYVVNNVDGANVEIRGSVNAYAANGAEITSPSNSTTVGTFSLTEGKKYKIEYISDNNLTDIYMWSPAGTHCNSKQAQSSTVTPLGDGRYHYQMIFTAGLRPTGADSGWPTTQSTNGSYTGTYNFRFDQDSITANRDFNITDLSVTEYVEPQGFTPDSKYEGIGCAGNPTYVILMDFDKIQYAMVDKGKLYVSRSWKRKWEENHSRELTIAELDLSNPGDQNIVINGRNRPAHFVNYDSCLHFGGDNGASSEQMNKMLWMGEALCVIDDYLYMFGEGAAWTYNGKESNNKCGEPIDVIWKIDQYAIQGLSRPHEDVAAVEYEKVNSLDEIDDESEYIILHESSIKDPVTQRNILYLLDANGNYNGKHLPKKHSSASSYMTQALTGDSRGIIGYEIREYSIKTEDKKTSLILNAEDDANKSLHWQFESAENFDDSGNGDQYNLKLKNRDLYFAKHPYLYFGDTLFAMTTTADANMKIAGWNNGDFVLYGAGDYTLWCNDGSVADSINKYTTFYSNHSHVNFLPHYHNLNEIAGTFHVNNKNHPAKAEEHQLKLHIYKRVSDPYASSYETQVYTDLQAKLTSDGTYNITLETYANNTLQYQKVDKRPTDFIFLIDSSGSLDQSDTSYFYTESSWSGGTVSYFANDNDFDAPSGEDPVTHGYTYTKNQYYRKASDGSFNLIYMAIRTSKIERRSIINTIKSIEQLYWIYYQNVNDGLYYIIDSNGNDSATGYTWAQFTALVDSDTSYSAKSTNINSSDRKKTSLTIGSHHTVKTRQRIDTIKEIVNNLTNQIYEDATTHKLDHRIALTTFGSNGNTPTHQWAGSGMYINSGSFVAYSNITSDNLKNAFFTKDNFGKVTTAVNSIVALGHTFPDLGFDVANDIINANNVDYTVNGDRTAVIIYISDGVPGYEEDDNRNIDVTLATANSALGESAANMKNNGAYIYSILIGNDAKFNESQFDERDFMKYISSEYTGSTSMSNPGPINGKENSYFSRIDINTPVDSVLISKELFKSINTNSTTSISKLGSGAILREHLTDAFDLTNATITYKTATSRYDGIGRLYFDAPQTTSGVTATIDKKTNNIEVTGFDYSAKNVSEYNSKNGNGAKLVIEITGVIADADANLVNTSINDTAKTALYQNRSYMSDILANDKPVKRFPTYHFSIPEYTYYMDYDIPMYDNDINGTLCSVDSTLQKQSTYKTKLSTGNMGIEFKNGNQDMVYTLNSQAGLTEKLSKGYVLIKRDDGTYDWFRLNIVPASTVYYEENKMEAIENSDYTAWTKPEDSAYENKYQSLSGSSDIFGSDETYSNSKEKFSLGTYKKVEVSSSANRSETQKFTFTGTGFDLYSACGNNTGIQTVTVRNASTNALVKVYMVDTYYNDATYDLLTQVPILHYVCEEFGTYTVEVTAAYYSFAGGLKTNSADTLEIEGTDIEATSAVADIPSTDELFRQIGMDELIGQEVEVIWMDENSIFNGGTGAGNMDITLQGDIGTSTNEKKLVNYIDGFRTYNPKTYNDEYIISEQNATYYSVIDTIKAGGMGGDGDKLTAYIEPGATGDLTFGNYLEKGGPKYEVYLAADQSIAFRFKAFFGDVQPHAMVSVRSASGAPKAKFASTNNPGHAYETGVLNGSETFYDITFNALGTDSADGSFVLTVTNTGSGLLAVDNIKITNATLEPISNVSLNSINELISLESVALEAGTFSVAAPETPTFVDAPADNPFIDPEGSIPDIDEIGGTDGSTEEPVKNFFDIVVDFFRNVIERIKEVLQALPVFWTKAK